MMCQDYNKQQIEHQRKKYRKLYEDICLLNDYKIYKAFPLRIDFDPTLSFVNCSICHFKKKYLNDDELESYCVSQIALRTNSYKSFFESKSLIYTAKLEMLGSFSPIKGDEKSVLNKHMRMQAEFLIEVFDNKVHTVIEISPILYNLISDDNLFYLKDKGFEVVVCEKNLVWKYGIDGIYGIGSNWIIKGNNQKCEFGNVIMLKKENASIGVESGGAIESLIRIENGFEHKIFANDYCNEYIYNRITRYENYIIEYFDALNVIGEIISWYENDLRLQIVSVMEKYIKIVKCVIILNGFSECQVYNDILAVARENEKWRKKPNVLYYKIIRLLNITWNIDVIVNNKVQFKRYVGYSPVEIKTIDVYKKMKDGGLI